MMEWAGMAECGVAGAGDGGRAAGAHEPGQAGGGGDGEGGEKGHTGSCWRWSFASRHAVCWVQRDGAGPV